MTTTDNWDVYWLRLRTTEPRSSLMFLTLPAVAQLIESANIEGFLRYPGVLCQHACSVGDSWPLDNGPGLVQVSESPRLAARSERCPHRTAKPQMAISTAWRVLGSVTRPEDQCAPRIVHSKITRPQANAKRRSRDQ